ncbi:hypothetical protein ACRAVF_19025 [Bradyrhizobium oligotrophicum S58]
MSKRPKDIPAIGDRVEMRYRNGKVFGTLENVNTFSDWAVVTWDAGCVGPSLCHLFELRRAQ